MIEIVVYFDLEYLKNESFFINEELEKDEITKIVNEKYDNTWYYYDIL